MSALWKEQIWIKTCFNCLYLVVSEDLFRFVVHFYDCLSNWHFLDWAFEDYSIITVLGLNLDIKSPSFPLPIITKSAGLFKSKGQNIQ